MSLARGPARGLAARTQAWAPACTASWTPTSLQQALLHTAGCACWPTPAAAGSDAPTRDKGKLRPAAPGTVKLYERHIFVRPAPPPGLDPGQALWWPPVVERAPELLSVFGALAAARDPEEPVAKVTAYTDLAGGTSPSAGTCDVMLFPEGVLYTSLSAGALSAVVAAHLRHGAAARLASTLPPEARGRQEELRGLQLFVCCHGSRDARCGAVGPALCEALRRHARARGLDAYDVRVLACSHVGGHKYAGNVLVRGAASPCDGDWFGGVSAPGAAAFLDGVLGAGIGGAGGAGEPALRPLWRGRAGLSPSEQRRLYEEGPSALDEEGPLEPEGF